MKYRLPAVVALVAFGAFSGACGGGGGSKGAGGSSVAGQPSAADTATPFDANILSAMVLGPSDVPLPGILAPSARAPTRRATRSRQRTATRASKSYPPSAVSLSHPCGRRTSIDCDVRSRDRQG